MILSIQSDYFLKQQNQQIFVMEKCCVFFEEWTEFLNIIHMNFSFKGQIIHRKINYPADNVSSLFINKLKRKT
jgi:hypothetical protein